MSTLRDRLIRLAFDQPELRDDLLPLIRKDRKEAAPNLLDRMLQDVKDPTPEEGYQYGLILKARALGQAAYRIKQLTGYTTWKDLRKHLEGVEPLGDNKYVEGKEQEWVLPILQRDQISKLKKWDALEREDPERLVIEVYNSPDGRLYEAAYFDLVSGGKDRIRLNRREKESGKVLYDKLYDILSDKSDEYESQVDR